MASSSGNLHIKLQREVTCLFCQEQLSDPRLLECLHVYCKDCISHMRLKNTANKYKCPQCSDSLVIEDINKLQPYTLAKVKARNLQLLRRVSQEDTSCDLCLAAATKNRGSISVPPALYICTDCREGQQFLCHSCSMPHYHRPEYRDHVLELVTNFQSSLTPTSPKKRDRRSTMAASSVCHDHGLQFRYFCQSCSSGLCQDCLPVHKTHNVIETGDAVEDAQKLVTSELADIIGLREVLTLSIKPIEEVKRAVEHQEEYLAGEIETRFVRINKELGFCEKKLKNQLSSVSQSKQLLLQQQVHQIQLLIDKVDRLAVLMSQAAEMPDETALMSLVNLFIEKARSLKREYSSVLSRTTSSAKIATIKSQVTLIPCERANMSLLLHPETVRTTLRDASVYIKMAHPPNCRAFGPGLSNGINQPIALNMTYFTVQLVNANNSPCTQSQDVLVKINIQRNGSTSVEKPNVVHKRQGRYLVSYCPRLPGIATINITVDNIDIHGSPFTVNITPPSPLSPDANTFWSIKELTKPSCIAITGNNDDEMNSQLLLVYDCASEKIVSINTSTCQVESILEECEFNDISGIDVMKERSSYLTSSLSLSSSLQSLSPSSPLSSPRPYIYVTSSTQHCLAKLNPENGKVLHQIGGESKKGSHESQFNTPVGILAYNNEVFVCDSLNHRIQIFESDNLIYKRQIDLNFASQQDETSLLSLPSEPIDITLNENKMMFISDLANSCILLLNSQEKFRSSFDHVTIFTNVIDVHASHLYRPRGVFCDRDGYLYVSDSGNRRIVVYNSHQTSDCIMTLGQKGKEDQDLIAPRGLVVDEQGRIIICDPHNKRLQVYSDILVKTISY